MGEEIRIHWFPGHMTKARRMITENVRLVDIVCEIIDARIPVSSRNPDLDELAGTKPRLIIINRIDQADPAVTRLWAEYFRKRGIFTLEVECKTGSGVSGFPAAVREILKDKLEAYAAKGLKGRSVRAMVVGIPNVGKSSFINRVARRKVAAASDKPGVTRGKQWIKIGADLELLDTPGILWPKFDSQLVAENLAFTGAIKDDILDVETLASNLMSKLKETYPQSIENRYKISVSEDDGGFG